MTMIAGVHAEVSARVSEVAARAQLAAERLAAAAASGSALTFAAAMEAAQHFAHLSSAVDAAKAGFSTRKAGAQAAVDAAVAGQPMPAVTRALEEAAQLGVDPSVLAAALKAARQRDADVAAGLLQAASSSQFDAAAFERLGARAASLGLQGDVAAARVVLDKRRRLLASKLARGVDAGGSAATLQVLATEAQALGMTQEAAALTAQLRQLKEGVLSELNSALARCNVQACGLLLERGEAVGLQPQALEGVRLRITQLQQEAAARLQEQAQRGSLASFKQARCAGTL